MAHAGSCLCGQVQYTIAAEPVGARMCWCRDCQKIASGSATINILFPAGSVQFAGEIATWAKIADSGNRIARGFCTQCGTHLFARLADRDDETIRIRAGTLDNPELMAPQAIIWTASAPSWARFDSSVPQYPAAVTAPPPSVTQE